MQLARILVVLTLLIVAAALATPPGRLPLALRGLNKLLRRDRGLQPETNAERPATASTKRRIAAFILVLGALVIALYP